MSSSLSRKEREEGISGKRSRNKIPDVKGSGGFGEMMAGILAEGVGLCTVKMLFIHKNLTAGERTNKENHSSVNVHCLGYCK